MNIIRNAFGLIEEFWKKNSKKAKKIDTKTPKRPRKSTADEADVSTTKKRGRKSQVAESEPGDNAGTSGARAIKKPRKSAPPPKKEEIVSDEEIIYNDMEQYMGTANWENLITNVDTIEREDDGGLVVYFTL